jgi:hypothetical protein
VLGVYTEQVTGLLLGVGVGVDAGVSLIQLMLPDPKLFDPF